jgi:hypothetical protein
MNARFVISVIVVFLLSSALSAVLHGRILGEDYARLATMGIYRTPDAARELMGWMMLGNLLFAIGFTWIYRAGRDLRPWLAQGVRFGIAVSLLYTLPMFLTYYVVQPTPSDLAAKQAVLGSLMTVILGIAAAFINRDPPRPRA